ncbi:MAG: glycosyltransferase family 2 protein [Bacteroidetes bacterium]|nr:glycosyltransferase family 2 protein [Bacteroidota bacterium]
MDLSVVIPVYNEKDSLEELYTRLSAVAKKLNVSYELIFVNDGSRDASLEKLMELSKRDSHVFYINFSRNFGHQIAVTAGIDHTQGKAVVIIDSDLQDPPELIEQMYLKYKEGFEVVYAQRSKRIGESWFKKITAKIFYRTMVRITNVKIPIDTGDYRLIDRKIVEYLKKMPEQNKFLRGQIAWMGYRQTAVEFVREERKYGETGYPLSKMIRFALDGITAFSDKPLTLVMQAGIVVSIISFLIIIYALIGYYSGRSTTPGWASIMVSTMFIGGIQLISIGVIGLYISRINKNVINRPLYLIQDTNLETQN